MMDNEMHMTLTADIAAAFLSHNQVEPAEVGTVISAIGAALKSLGEPPAEVAPVYEPAVNPRRSVRPDAIVSLIDGRPYKSLRRHLTAHGLTPAQYRERYGLAPDYPMVCANYTAVRRDLAKRIGLGRKPGRRRAA